MKKLIKKAVGVCLCAVLCLIAGAGSVCAAPLENQIPALLQNTGDLVISLQYLDDNDSSVAIDGAEFSLYRVADLVVEDGKISYVRTSSFSGAVEDYSEMTVAESKEIAKRLAKETDGKVPDVSGFTDSDGEVAFSSLPAGVYLVVESARKGTANQYEQLDAYLLMLPELQESNGNYTWNYQVQTKPKTSLVKKPDVNPPGNVRPGTEKTTSPPPTGSSVGKGTPVKTDDWGGVYLWMGLMVVAGAGLILTIGKSKTRR